jgi:hypothetical protein
LGKRECEFVEDDVSRGNDAPGRQVETAIAAMRARVPEKHTCAGARRKLVRCGGGEVWIAQAAKNAEVHVGRRCVMKELMGYGKIDGLARA